MSVPPELLAATENPAWVAPLVAQTDELITKEFKPFLNHFFAAVPEDEGITSLRFNTTTTANASVTRDGPDAQVHVDAATQEEASIETSEKANYAPGSAALAGLAVGLPNGLPTGEQDAHFGITNCTNGYGAGIKDFNAGEGTPGASEPGVQPYVFLDIADTRTRVPQEHWNIDTLDGGNSEANPSGGNLNDFLDGAIVRLPHLWYGRGELLAVFGVFNQGRFELHPAHAFIPPTDGMPEQPNVPLKVHVLSNETAAALDVNVRAVHYDRLTDEADFRDNGETRRGQTVSTSWEPLLSWRKRDGWAQVNTRPVAVAIASNQDMSLDLQLGTELNGASFSTPTHTSGSETAVEVDIDATGFSSTGERRWIGQVTGGQGSQRGISFATLDFNLPQDEIVSLAGKVDAGLTDAEVDSAVLWGSEF